MKKNKIVVGITHGDINGIGYEVILKTLTDNRLLDKCVPVIYGSPKVAGYHRKALDLSNVSLNIAKSANEINPKRVNIVNCIDENIRVELGKSTPSAGQSSYQALEAAIKDMKAGKLDVLVTAPIDKSNIQSAGFNFPGHTEYLVDEFEANDALMLMVGEQLRIGVATGHVPLAVVPKLITLDLLLSKISLMNDALQNDFNIRKPRIAVLSLNPHAGDNGVIGDEEQNVIIPAIETARNDGMLAYGPYPSDGFFGSGNYLKFDAILAMYHDQGLTPFKSIVFEEGVNYTAGLPVIRTSPAHGTAYEIAGEGQASPDSFRKAIYLACDIYKNRNMNDGLAKNAMEQIDANEV